MMVRSNRILLKKLKDQKGFTLIEMAIVLIIIGIIIGAVVKGKDVMKSAEQKRLYSTFVREWQVAYNNYYDRTGWILGDEATDSNNTGARDGLCSLATEGNLTAQLTSVGLTPPSSGPTGLTNVRTYTDSNGNPYVLTLDFNYHVSTGNFIQISGPNGVPIDMGLSWDRIIDGTAAGTAGDLLYDANANLGNGLNGWPDASVPAGNNSHIRFRLEF